MNRNYYVQEVFGTSEPRLLVIFFNKKNLKIQKIPKSLMLSKSKYFQKIWNKIRTKIQEISRKSNIKAPLALVGTDSTLKAYFGVIKQTSLESFNFSSDLKWYLYGGILASGMPARFWYALQFLRDSVLNPTPRLKRLLIYYNDMSHHLPSLQPTQCNGDWKVESTVWIMC